MPTKSTTSPKNAERAAKAAEKAGKPPDQPRSSMTERIASQEVCAKALQDLHPEDRGHVLQSLQSLFARPA